MHMCTKCEVSMYNPVPGGMCTDTNADTPMQDDDTDANDDRQSMIV